MLFTQTNKRKNIQLSARMKQKFINYNNLLKLYLPPQLSHEKNRERKYCSKYLSTLSLHFGSFIPFCAKKIIILLLKKHSEAILY